MKQYQAKKWMAAAIREAGVWATDAQIEKAAAVFRKSVTRFEDFNRGLLAVIAAAVSGVVAWLVFR